jgi:hypothetical protein
VLRSSRPTFPDAIPRFAMMEDADQSEAFMRESFS